MRRPARLNTLDPMEAAAAVGQFLEPGAAGPWRIERFTVSKDAGLTDYLRSHGDGGGRWTPPGDYVMLTNTDPDSDYSTMMSNTPDELRDHEPFLVEAEGRVLVTGLGLSCILSGLLAKPEVEHVDVIEADADVIALVGPSYEGDNRVTIHHADALAWEIPADASWDYAWHDIWAFIADYNLDDDKAENGISYRKLFRKYAPHVERQAAWAFDLALAMRRSYELAEAEEAEWQRRWRDADTDGRVAIQIEWMRQPNPVVAALQELEGANPQPLSPEDVEALIALHGGREALEERAQTDELRFHVDAQPKLPEARKDVPMMIATELASYGLTVADDFFARPTEVAAA